MKGRIASLIAVWALGPFALWLSSYRPFAGDEGVAAQLPARIGGFELVDDKRITRRQATLLGTDDAVWRTYRGPDGASVFVVLVCHRENWKSIHPPDICLRGSNMVIDEDRLLDDAGLLRTFSRDRGERYLSLYRYGGAELATGSYFRFFAYHAPRALFRASVGGYLIRVETWIGPDEAQAAAAARCRAFLDAATPVLSRMSAP